MKKGGIFRRIGSAARQACAVALLALFLPDAALAQAGARTCRQLEAQLASLSSGGRAAPAQAQRYEAAIERQREHMARARQQARRAGCGLAVSGNARAFCGEINATLARMDRNLADLQQKRARLSRTGNDRRERARIMAALDANGCRSRERAPAGERPREQRATDGRSVQRIGRPANLSGSFRTLCVRTCDGYFFPISWSVSQRAFERDERACQAMCPGTEVELHYHRVSGEDSADMVSAATGLPYSEMDNAFLYRKPGVSIPAGCGCGAAAQEARGFQTIGGDYSANEVPGPFGMTEDRDATATAAIPLPSEKPDPAEDPETLSTREGGLDADGLRRLATPPPPARPVATAAAGTEKPGERQVRVVGPTFLPDPEAAEDRPVPAPARGR